MYFAYLLSFISDPNILQHCVCILIMFRYLHLFKNFNLVNMLTEKCTLMYSLIIFSKSVIIIQIRRKIFTTLRDPPPYKPLQLLPSLPSLKGNNYCDFIPHRLVLSAFKIYLNYLLGVKSLLKLQYVLMFSHSTVYVIRNVYCSFMLILGNLPKKTFLSKTHVIF